MCFEENGALYDLWRLDLDIEKPTYTKLYFSSGAGDLVPDGVAPLRRGSERGYYGGALSQLYLYSCEEDDQSIVH